MTKSKMRGKDYKKNNLTVYIVAFISALGGMLFGYDTGVISSAILFIQKEFSLGTTMEEITVSAVLIGAVVGAAIAGKLADSLGRRKVIIVAATIFAFGSIGTAFAPNDIFLIVGRVIIGLAIGAASFTTPMYISEVSPPAIRGELVSLNQLAVTVGIVISYLAGYILSCSGNWRLMLALAAIPASVLGVGMFFMPQSPRWLVSNGNIDKARDVIKKIRHTQNVEKEISEIEESIGKQKGGWKELSNPLIRPALIVGIGLAVFQQITGINTVIYYAPMIFKFAGFKSASSAILATFGVGVVNVVMTIIAMKLIDKVGRRPLLLIGLIGMSVSLAVLGLAFYLQNLTATVGWIAMVSLMVYVGSFAIGMGPIFWLLISEIYPIKVRGLAMSVATMFNWGANFVVGITFLSLIKILGRPWTFWLYAGLTMVAWVFTLLLVPETKGKTLEQIEEHWRSGKHPLELKNS